MRVSRTAWLGILGLAAVLLLLVGLAGVRCAVAAVAVACLCALPGLLLLPPRVLSLPALAATAVTGWALTSFGTALVGLVIHRFHPALTLTVAVIGSAGGLWRLRRGSATLAPAPPDPVLPLLVIGLVALLALPWLRVGTLSDQGYAYRLYFNYDFFKHMGVVNALRLGPLPPHDSFAAAAPLRYYWLGYLLPATVADVSGEPGDVQGALLGACLLEAVMFVLLLWGCLSRLGSRRHALLGALLVILSFSFDGVSALTLRRVVPAYAAFDADPLCIDATQFLGAASTFQPCTAFKLCLHVPQHLMAVLILLTWLQATLTLPPGTRTSPLACLALLVLPGTSLVVGALAGFVILATEFVPGDRVDRSLVCSGFLGGGLLVLVAGMVGRQTHWEGHFLKPCPPSAIFWLPAQMFTSLGAPLVAAVLAWGAFLRAPLPRRFRLALVLTLLTSVCGIVGIRTVATERMAWEVDVKVSYLVLPVLGMVAATGLPRRGSALMLLGLVALLGLSSTPVELAWHSRLTGPPRTTLVPAATMCLLRAVPWLVPPTAIVQGYPHGTAETGGPDSWVPIFAGRQTAVSPPPRASCSPDAVAVAGRIFRDADPEAMHAAARSLGITHLFVDDSIGRDDARRCNEVLGSRPDLFHRRAATPTASLWALEAVPESICGK